MAPNELSDRRWRSRWRVHGPYELSPSVERRVDEVNGFPPRPGAASLSRSKLSLFVRLHCWENRARHHGVFPSFGFGWFGILLLMLNLLKDVAARGAGKSFRRRVGHVDLGQGECPVLNLADGEDHCADGISRWGRTIFDRGV